MLSTIFPSRAPLDDLIVERRVPVRVLVVGDRSARRDDAVAVLGSDGCEVFTSEPDVAESALPTLGVVDALVLDVAIPDLDAFAMCRRLKFAQPASPILLLSSASASVDSWTPGLEAGADGYLKHPVGAIELRAAVHALARLRREETDRDRKSVV